MTAEEYRNYLDQDFSDVDINEMTDLRMIKTDRNMKVKVRFANNGISMEQAFENMLLSV